MRRLSFFSLLLLVLWMSNPQPATAQEAVSTPSPSPSAPGTEPPSGLPAVTDGFTYPRSDSEVRGVINITGILPAGNFSSLDLSFTYQDDITGTWFPIPLQPQPFVDNILAVWDTTQVSDGFYSLRLRIFLADGIVERTVTNIRVRNYSPLETSTPLPTSTPTETPTPTRTPRATGLPTATITPTFTPIPSPTAMPANPAMLSPGQILLNMGKGALAVFAAFLFFGALLALSQKLRS